MASTEPTRRVLVGGTLIDGTGSAARPADVIIDGSTIADVVNPGQAPTGAQILDCTGLVIAPGFIDTHSHSDLRVLAEPALPMKVRQGVTLDVLGQDGISVAPVDPDAAGDVRRQLAGLLGNPDVAWQWRTVADYLGVLAETHAALDLAYLVPHGGVRRAAIGMEARLLTAPELARAEAVLASSLDDGALGMSSGLIYPPCCYAPTDELVALCKVVAQRDKVFVVHMRSESDRILEATDEMIQVARQSGVRLHISHFKIAGYKNADRVEALIERVEAARRAGIIVTADQYPYTAGSTMLGAILPPWAHEGGSDRTVTRLRDAAQRDAMRAEMEVADPQDWDNFWKWTGPEGIVISDVASGQRPELVGLTVAAAASRFGAGQRPIDFAMDLLADERMGVAMISHSQSESVVERLMTLPYVNGCTDGLLGGKPHPRAFGSYPRVLGRYVRERKLLPLVEAIRKLTSQAADAFKLHEVGRVVKGLRANLVAFDPQTILDTATFEQPVAYPVGLAHVLVGGAPVVLAGEPTSARPGVVARG